MGVPQRRERVFFVCLRKDIAKPFLYQKDMFTQVPKIELNFNENVIKWGCIIDDEDNKETLSNLDGDLWEKRKKGDVDLTLRERNILSRFNAKFLYKEKPANTITGGEQCVLFDKKRNRNKKELLKCGTYHGL